MKVEFPIPAAWEILWWRGRGLRWELMARFEGADGNVCASRVWKETLAGFVPACFASFPEIVLRVNR